MKKVLFSLICICVSTLGFGQNLQTQNYLTTSYQNGKILIGVDAGGYYIGSATGTGTALPMFIGSNTSRIQFNTGGTERFRINSTGLVGIGTSTPQATLDIVASEAAIRVKSTDATKSPSLNLDWGPNAGMMVSYHPNSAAGFIDNKYLVSSGFTYGDMHFRRNVGGTMTSTMTIKGESGNVGIGSTSPFAPLTIEKISTAPMEGGVALAFEGGGFSEIGYRFRANGGNYYQRCV